MNEDLDWSPYSQQAARRSVQDFVTCGAIEYELCLEGGRDVIVRTDRRGDQPVTSEVGRPLTRSDTVDLWTLIKMGDAA